MFNGDLKLSARYIQSPWGQGADSRLTAQWVHAVTNPIPVSGQAAFQCDRAESPLGGVSRFQVSARFSSGPAAERAPPDASWAWWTNLAPYRLDWECRLADVRALRLTTDDLVASGTWRAPQLNVTNLFVSLYGGSLSAVAGLDVATRALNLRLATDFDLHQLSPLLPQAEQTWLKLITWETPPQLHAEASAVLPSWTNAAGFTNPLPEIAPTLCLTGEVNLPQGGAYRQVPVTAVRSHFLYSNLCWHLPDVTVTRPEGRLVAEHRLNHRTGEFYSRVSSGINLGIVRSLLDDETAHVFDLLSFGQPSLIEGEIWGRGSDPDALGLKGRVALTNVTFRGETATAVQTALQYTNQILDLLEPRVQRGAQHARADGIKVDLKSQLLYLTNATGRVDPLFITHAIGPEVTQAIEPYRFAQPPDAHVYGTIPLHGEEGADLHFDLKGGPFHWWKFNLPYIAGHVHWRGESVILTNVQMDFYYGHAGGWAAFDFRPRIGTDFTFEANVTNALLQALMADLATTSNHLEGTLGGTLVVSRANTEDWRSVFGYGDANLHDGLIWDIPLFGRFSPVLNSIAPGLGNSRVNAGTCSFVMTNGVLRSGDMEFHSPAMRLQYRGTVDLESRVNARVEAELLRDVWLFGPLFSTVLWPVTKVFEYKVTGTLDDPKTEPLFLVPRLMLMPFHPIRTLKSLVPGESGNGASTNAPPPVK